MAKKKKKQSAKAYRAKWLKNNQDWVVAYRKKYYHKNLKKIKAYKKAWIKAHPDAIKKYRKDFYDKHYKKK